MRTNGLIAGLIVVVIAAGATGLVWQNNSADQAGRIDISSAQKIVGEKFSSGLTVDKEIPTPATSANGVASLEPVKKINDLPAKSVQKPSSEQTNPRVSITTTKVDLDAPRFDIVRIDTSGTTIIAGRGKPGTDVDILVGNEMVATASVENSGAFATVLQTPMAAGVQKISLRTKIGTRDVTSPEIITVIVPDTVKKKQPLVVLSKPDVPSQVIQRPNPVGRDIGLNLDVIDYTEAGLVILSGTAKVGAWVRVLLDRDILGKVQVTPSGLWTLTSPEDVTPGRYTIRLEEWVSSTRMARQVTFPFERAELNDLVIADGEMIVQPGHNLWSIAKSNYGSGIKYTVIYAANAGKITNPDLIYPGQILNLPNN